MAEGDLDQAGQLGQESVDTFRSHGDRYGLGLALAFPVMTLQPAGDVCRAGSCVGEALDLSRDSASLTSSIYRLASMSFGAVAAGDMVRLRGHTSEAIGLLRKLADNYEDP